MGETAETCMTMRFLFRDDDVSDHLWPLANDTGPIRPTCGSHRRWLKALTGWTFAVGRQNKCFTSAETLGSECRVDHKVHVQRRITSVGEQAFAHVAIAVAVTITSRMGFERKCVHRVSIKWFSARPTMAKWNSTRWDMTKGTILVILILFIIIILFRIVNRDFKEVCVLLQHYRRFLRIPLTIIIKIIKY